MSKFKLYIARDEGKWDEDVQTTGELNLFYDTPQLLFDVKKTGYHTGVMPVR